MVLDHGLCKPKTIKSEGDHLARVSIQVLNILRGVRSGTLVIGLWCIAKFDPRRNLSAKRWISSIDQDLEA